MNPLDKLSRTRFYLLLLFLFILLTGMSSCKKDDIPDICGNLLEQGTATLPSLIGEWNFQYFGYTSDGNKIKNKDEIHRGHMNVTDSLIYFRHSNSIYYNYLLDCENSISITQKGSTYVNPPQEEIDITCALVNAKCFVITGDKLFFHYKEKDKKNILILAASPGL
jgi:hypothetical protein